MPSGFEFRRGGWGRGFRGSSAPWPFVGSGRGGLPRCGYFFSGAAVAPARPGYGYSPYYGGPGMPFYGAPHLYSGAGHYAPQMNREQELDCLRNQSEAIKGQLEQIDARIRELETD